ncbi:tRNA-specific 2-thiouridylase MnmA [Candidatus Magnetobacterium bavaricum]|uniref:tRNA-specific 2-thiouridylase MnmA n=1 Tax=Candidatus Magnetobacterium bavaricum TaxID=29290 RepID=A0A0F3GIJ8_9BACT|nr:tRNA-specific 2-thiouridylase MnmA [Candidatus Magnetobacterium bavaricum]
MLLANQKQRGGKSVLIGMSGGVDSSIAAYLLKQHGYYTEGLSFLLWGRGNSGGNDNHDNRNTTETTNTCCCAASLNDAGATAAALGIKHGIADVRLEFMQRVIEPFIESYGRGMTPNPCVLCNQHVKFPYLLAEANSRGFDYIATGHYAVATDQQELMTATDMTKDQSYFLYVLSLDMLSRIKFPLGRWTKPQVRELAAELDLPCHKRPESQDICFVDNAGYRAFINVYSGDIRAAGPIVDVDGKTIGTHRGLFAYTVGQRRGIGIAARQPLYVIDIDTANNTLIVGPKDVGLKTQFTVDAINWLVPATEVPDNILVKFRSAMAAVPANIEGISGSAAKNVVLHTPQWAPARGQSAVFYVGNRVIGGGIIVLV